MLQSLNVKGIRGITQKFSFDTGINILHGRNAAGKSTVFRVINDIMKGKTSIKEGEATLLTFDEEVFSLKNGKLHGSPDIGVKMDLMTPGFFMNGTKVAGVNKTTEDQRKTISELLGIDREGFFKDAGIDYEIGGLHSQLKDCRTQEKTYTAQIMEEEEYLIKLPEVKAPALVELVSGNEAELERLKNDLAFVESKLKTFSVSALPVAPDVVELISGNEKDLEDLKAKLDAVKIQGTTIHETCPTCKQHIADSTAMKESLRDQYKEIASLINNFEITPSNTAEYQEYMNRLSDYKVQLSKREAALAEETTLIDALAMYQKEIKDFVFLKGNLVAYQEYQTQLQAYNSYSQDILTRQERIKSMTQKINALDTISIEEKIKAYKDAERKFVEFVDNKLQIGDLKIIFFRELQTPNSDGDRYTPTFDIEFKGKLYDECSGGEKAMIDTILATIFIKAYNLIDFCLIDSAEISMENIKYLFMNYSGHLQFFATRIADVDGLVLIQDDFSKI